MSAYVRFSPEFISQKPSWYFHAACVYVPVFSGVLFASQTVFLDKYKTFASYCRNGQPVPIPEDLKKTFEKVKEDLPVDNYFKQFINVFLANSFNPIHAGSSRSLYGGLVGVPKYFTYKSIDDAKEEAKTIRVQESPVNWDLVEPEIRDKFFNSLVLSEKAIKYAMAYNSFLVDNYAMYMYPGYPLIVGALNCLLGDYATRKFQLLKKPLTYSILLAFVVFGTSICFWISLGEVHKMIYEKEANKKMSKMSEEYIEGAVEYWSKLTDRNIALRHIMSRGESNISPLGKESFILGSNGLQPVDQKHHYEKLLEELKAKKKEQEKDQESLSKKEEN